MRTKAEWDRAHKAIADYTAATQRLRGAFKDAAQRLWAALRGRHDVR